MMPHKKHARLIISHVEKTRFDWVSRISHIPQIMACKIKMEIKLELKKDDYKFIQNMKKKGIDITNIQLCLVGDLLLSNIEEDGK